MAKENSVIDWEAYGTLLKAARLANGYSRGKKLTDAVEEKTGMRISERTIYALEDASLYFNSGRSTSPPRAA